MQVLKAAEPQVKGVVDFGCGDAAWLKSTLLDPSMPPLQHAVGIDVSPTALARGKRRMAVAAVKRRTPEWASVPMPELHLYEVRALRSRSFTHQHNLSAARIMQLLSMTQLMMPSVLARFANQAPTLPACCSAACRAP